MWRRKTSEIVLCLCSWPGTGWQVKLSSHFCLLLWVTAISLSFDLLNAIFSSNLMTFFPWWLCCLKCPLSEELKNGLSLLNTGRLRCVLKRKYVCWISLIRTWVVMLTTSSSVLIHQQYVLSKVLLNRNTQMTRLCVDWLMKMLSQHRRTGPCIFPG